MSWRMVKSGKTEPDPGGRRGRLVVFYDGSCGLCSATIRRVLMADRRGNLFAAPLGGVTALELLGPLGDPELGPDSVVVWDGREGLTERAPRIWYQSDAGIVLARYLGGWWSPLRLLALVPKSLRDWGYDVMARRRHRWARHHEACLIPDPAIRGRFLP